MAGRRVGEGTGERVDTDADGRDHLVLVHVAQHPSEDIGRGDAVVGVGSERPS